MFLLFSTALNVGLDLLFIVSFRWGVAGAAIATVSAQLISTLGCFVYAFMKYPELHLQREDWRITRHDVVRHIIQGVPAGTSVLCARHRHYRGAEHRRPV